MKRLLTILVAAAMALTAYPAFAAIQGSPHFFGGQGTGYVYGTCDPCHVPHAARGSKRLWNQTTITSIAGVTTWGSTPKGVGMLCASCHANTYFVTQNVGGLQAHQMTTKAYADTSHGNDVATLTGSGKLDPQTVPASGLTGKPYTNGAKMECTSCHNPHQDGTVSGATSGTGTRPFLRANTMNEPISNFCAECHSTRKSTVITTTDNTTTGASTDVQVTGNNFSHNHPVNYDYGDDATNGTGYFKSQAAGGALTANVYGASGGALSGWSLGGKFQLTADGSIPTGSYTVSAGVAGITQNTTYQIGCMTCHSIHKPDTTNPSYAALWLLAVDNSGSTGKADLCETCHGQAITGSRWATRAGGVATGSDHPIDGTISDTAISSFITGWSGGTKPFAAGGPRTRTERVPTGVSNLWPTGSTTYQIMCTSCHSAHRAGSRLRRANGDGSLWCKSCHPSVSPLGHHSHKYNAGDKALGGLSVLDCADCHFDNSGNPTGTGGLIHNGFAFYNVAGDNTRSAGGPVTALASGSGCGGCHAQNNNGYQANVLAPSGGTGGGVPPVNRLGATNGAGSVSHYVGGIDTNAGGTGINVKTGYWNGNAMLPDHTGHRRDYSKYGTVLPGVANYTSAGFNFKPTASDSSIAYVGCESCHSVLGNIGRATSGPILANMSSGWENNLLLQNYQDDSYTSNPSSVVASMTQANAENVTGEFCVGCHNQGNSKDTYHTGDGVGGAVPASAITTWPNTVAPPNMHPMTNWSITKAKDVGRSSWQLQTTPDLTDPITFGTYADAASTRPPVNGGSTAGGANQGAVSYSFTNAMDCDSCHRPHNAPTASYSDSSKIKVRSTKVPVSTKTGNVPTILEFADTAGDNGSFCMRCHSY